MRATVASFGFKLRHHAVCFAIVRIIKPAVFPAIGTIGLKVPEDRQAARRKKLDVTKRREIAESVTLGRKTGADMARLYSIGHQPCQSTDRRAWETYYGCSD
jgi:hypothetical protein